MISRDVSISALGLARLHFLITLRPGEPVPAPDYRDVEARIAEVTRSWSDDLADLLLMAGGEADSGELFRRYERSFPEAYKEDFSAEIAVRDIRRLEQLPDVDGLAFDLYTPPPDDAAQRRLKILRTGSHISLARVLPMLSHMGMEVLDERPYELERRDGSPAWIYDFGLGLPAGVELEPGSEHAADVLESLRRLWRGDAEQDGFNALVLGAGLNWRQVTVLRAYAKYLRQAGTPFSQGYIEQTLSEHPGIARQLVELFETRFDPSRQSRSPIRFDSPHRPARLTLPADRSDRRRNDPTRHRDDTIVAAVLDALGEVGSLDQDRILRALLGLITATLRTNVFRDDCRIGAEPATTAGRTAPRTVAQPILPAVAFKLDPQRVDGLPEPRPKFEIWVYSPRLEGVHLRFGLVARGGLRWSDRREDFRTEILGLVKAQMVKNAVIVPVGAKGGFVVKPRPIALGGPIDPTDRDEVLRRGHRLLPHVHLQPARRDRRLQPTGAPTARRSSSRRRRSCATTATIRTWSSPRTRAPRRSPTSPTRSRWSAASGSATRSPPAARSGYDHKAMGITARGAWESVKYHFRERGLDIQSEDFTVVGVGDMSGDVFGNGMLLSEHIRLVAAFDHRHIFLDPTPDAAVSFAERRRLFELPRSSWADYNGALISAGGGVFPRTLKSVPISPAVAAALGLAAGTTALPPIAADARHPGRRRRPAVERRHRHLRQGVQRVRRRGRRQGQRRAARRRGRPARPG